MTPRTYSNTSVETTLASGITAGAASLVVADATGYPAAPFAIVVDVGSALNEEIMLVTAKSGTTFTVTRAYDDTTAKAHSAGASVIHAVIAADFTDLQAADTSEAVARAAADTALQTNITNESGTRAADDNTIAGNLTTHTGLTTTAHGGIVASTDPRLTDARTPTAHQASHQSGASDALSGLLDAIARLTIRKNTGVDVGSRRRLNLIEGANVTLTVADDAVSEEIDVTIAASGGGGGVSDGDKGDITVSGSGATWTIDNNVVTYAKMQDISATSRILGRATSGAGDVEELTGAQALAITGAQTAVAEGRSSDGSTHQLSLPGVEGMSSATATMIANEIYYEPILVTTPISIDQLAIVVSTAGAASTTARLGLYNANINWQPTTLVVDAGTVAVDSTGAKTASVSQTLQPGRYLLAIASDGVPVLRVVRGGNRLAGLRAASSAALLAGEMRVTAAYGPFASTGVAWTTVSYNTTPLDHHVFMRVSTP